MGRRDSFPPTDITRYPHTKTNTSDKGATYAGFCSVIVARMMGMLMHCTKVDVTSAGRALEWVCWWCLVGKAHRLIIFHKHGRSCQAWIKPFPPPSPLPSFLPSLPAPRPRHAKVLLQELLPLLRPIEDGRARPRHAEPCGDDAAGLMLVVCKCTSAGRSLGPKCEGHIERVLKSIRVHEPAGGRWSPQSKKPTHRTASAGPVYTYVQYKIHAPVAQCIYTRVQSTQIGTKNTHRYGGPIASRYRATWPPMPPCPACAEGSWKPDCPIAEAFLFGGVVRLVVWVNEFTARIRTAQQTDWRTIMGSSGRPRGRSPCSVTPHPAWGAGGAGGRRACYRPPWRRLLEALLCVLGEMPGAIRGQQGRGRAHRFDDSTDGRALGVRDGHKINALLLLAVACQQRSPKTTPTPRSSTDSSGNRCASGQEADRATIHAQRDDDAARHWLDSLVWK